MRSVAPQRLQAGDEHSPAAYAPLQIADHSFPLTSHTITCGE
jgi:hypothetical protein